MKTRRSAAGLVAAVVLAVPSLTACNLTGSATCDAFTMTLSAPGGGGKGAGGKSKSGKTKTKTGNTKPKTGGGGSHSDDCD